MESAFSLNGKVAIVTGGAGGIGSATTRLMLDRGASVAIADLDLDRAEQLAATLDRSRVLALGVDLADEASIKAMVAATVDHFGKLDILHNNAAALAPEHIGKDADILSMDTAVWDMTFTVNCRGPMLTMREALPHLIKTRGCIVTTASNSALQGHFLLNAYTASKAALFQLIRSVAASYGRLGVRCNGVGPGVTMTPALRANFPEAMLNLIEEETLRDQLGEPEDIAEVVAFLASDAARNITGEIIISDGGFSNHVPGMERVRTLMGG